MSVERHASDAEVLRDLARVKAIFQLRAIEVVIRGEVPVKLQAPLPSEVNQS